MNSDFVLNQAAAMAARLRRETPADFAADLTAPLAGKYQQPKEEWQYGYGAFDESQGRTASFAQLPHWTGSVWQGGAELPDPQHGWALWHAAGGHPGADPSHLAIRRWIAPQAGTLHITGKLQHPSEHGNGVRGRIVSSKSGVAGTWQVKQSESATDVASIAVEPGDTIDFVVDSLGELNCDSFVWTAELKLTGAESQPLGTWHSQTDFHGPNAAAPLPQLVASAWQTAFQRLPTADELAAGCQFVHERQMQLQASGTIGDRELAPLTSLCQQLLSANEFLYVD
jgi:hypothetical protein